MSTHATHSASEQNGLAAIFQNRNFGLLWVSQLFGQSAQDAIFFVEMLMMEDLTRSSALVGLMVLIYNLPSLMFSLPFGVIIDRFRKKTILLFCNISRVFVVAGFIFFLRYGQGGGLLTAVYILTFVLSAIGQLSDPAEVAMVPLLVSPDHLLAANSVFRLLFNVAQVLGLLFMAPLSVKFGGIDGAFATISVAYMITAALIWPISVHEPPPDVRLIENMWSNLWEELRAGWQFIIARQAVFVAICQHALMTMLTMVIAVLAPGFVTRVLGMQTTDAMYIFFSAGLGMFLTILFTSRVGYRYQRELLVGAGLLIVGVALLGFALVAWNNRVAGETVVRPSLGLILQVMFMALGLGAGGTLSTVGAQTLVQERTPLEIRGRVITAEFLFANIAGLVPMLLISSLADVIGIPEVLTGLTALVLVSAVLSFRFGQRLQQEQATDKGKR